MMTSADSLNDRQPQLAINFKSVGVLDVQHTPRPLRNRLRRSVHSQGPDRDHPASLDAAVHRWDALCELSDRVID